MTREQSEAWIDALDVYLEAKRQVKHHAARVGGDYHGAKDIETKAREDLIETMYPIVTGFRR